MIKPLLFSLCLLPLCAAIPPEDHRGEKVADLNTLRTFPNIESRAQWERWAKDVREQVLVSCGLMPMPPKTPLNANIFGRIDHDDYTIEKVYFESYPGFYVAGNLYRPRNKGKGPFPAVLNPHGHWKNGRMADTAEGSIAARCISFARQGMIAFSWDMVGYNDSLQATHQFAKDPANLPWNISLMGLQTWNSIRALDFLASLSDTDKSRLACTGESGGGTQTFMLGAVDNRLALQAPIVMVSHSMQGGCLCENAPGLRVDYSNMEIAAVPAPRPQILVAAAGDWTKDTLTVEGPSIEHIYKLFNAGQNFKYERFNFDHNYNQTSREAVYKFFAQQFHPAAPMVTEAAYKKEPDADLRVFPDGKLPPGALTEEQLIRFLRDAARARWEAALPHDRTSLAAYKKNYEPVWRHSLELHAPSAAAVEAASGAQFTFSTSTAKQLFLGRNGQPERIPALYLEPEKVKKGAAVILADPKGIAAFWDGQKPSGLARALLAQHIPVLLLDLFQTGSLEKPGAGAARKYTINHFSTYNRTDLQERVQDLVTAGAYLRSALGGKPKVLLAGSGRAGLWCLMAAPAMDAVFADSAELATNDESMWLAQDIFVPGIRSFGAFEGAALLAAPNPVCIQNASAAQWPHLSRAYSELKADRSLETRAGAASDEEITAWLLKRT